MTILTRQIVDDVLLVPASFRSAVAVEASFKVGERIRVRNMHPGGHFRVPRYVRGHVGSIVADHGVFLVPDFTPGSPPLPPQHLYNVRFAATELWGEPANDRDSLHIELWDYHLERL